MGFLFTKKARGKIQEWSLKLEILLAKGITKKSEIYFPL